MKMSLNAVIFVMVIMLLAACGKKDEFKLELSGEYETKIVLQALDEKVSIKDIVVNRGKCVVKWPRVNISTSVNREVIGRTLEYGQVYSVYVACSTGNVREVSVTTKKGTRTFKY